MSFLNASEVTANYVEAGVQKTRYPITKTILLATLAGCIIALAGAVTSTATHGFENMGLIKLVSGLLFPFGLGIVVLSGSELFTGSCLISISVFEKRLKISSMLSNWLLVYIGNFIGSIIVAAACAFFGQLGISGGLLAAYTIKIAAAKCALPFANGIVLGIFCNLLVCFGVLLSLSAKDTTGKILGCYLPVSFFVICGFEHCIANMFFVPAGLFAMQVPEYAAKAIELGIDTGALTWGRFLACNLLPVTIGNILGGAGLGAVMWACYLRKPLKVKGLTKRASVPHVNNENAGTPGYDIEKAAGDRQ